MTSRRLTYISLGKNVNGHSEGAFLLFFFLFLGERENERNGEMAKERNEERENERMRETETWKKREMKKEKRERLCDLLFQERPLSRISGFGSRNRHVLVTKLVCLATQWVPLDLGLVGQSHP